MTTERIRIPHVGALDGLRGAAVAGVVLFHGGHLTGGYLGVDLFFVLSGYLITSLLLAEWSARGAIALGAFWARRARRLLPALVLVLFAVAIYCLVFADSSELDRIRADGLATIGYVANWRAIFRGQSYFEILQSVPSPLDHTWSLAIEEQFYVIWPLVFVGLVAWWKRRAAEAVLVIALVLGAASTGLMALLYDPDNVNRAYYGTDTRSFALFAGIAIAAYVHLWGHPRSLAARAAVQGSAFAAIGLLVWMWMTVDGQTGRLYRGGFFFAGIAAAVLIAASADPQRGPIGWLFSFPPLRWLGLISYGLYLWHWPVDVVMTPERIGLTGWPLFGLRTVVAIAIAIASYFLVEMPIRRGALRPTQWRVAIPTVAAAMIAAIVLTTVGGSNAEAFADIEYAPRRGQRVLIVGDSMAKSLAPGFDAAKVNFGLSWAPGCRLIHGRLRFDNAYSNNCPWERAWTQAVDRTGPKQVVVMMGVWDLFDVRPTGASDFLTPGTEEWAQVYSAQLQRLVDTLSARGARVTLLTIPCSARIQATGAAQQFLSGAYDTERVGAANTVIRALAVTGRAELQVVDLNEKLCPGGAYQARIDGVDVRTDGTHLTTEGAELVARWLAPKLGLAAAKPSS